MPKTSAFRLSPFAPRRYGMHPFFLSFDPGKEEEFVTSYNVNNLQYMRAAAILAVLFWLIFGITDMIWIKSDALHNDWLIRYGLVVPALVSAIVASFQKKWIKAVPWLALFGIVAASLGLMLMNRTIALGEGIPFEAGHLIILVAGFTFMRLRFSHALIAGVLITTIALFDVHTTIASPSRVAYDFILFVVASVFCGFACYAMEYFARHDFLLQQQIESDRKQAMEAANLRTAQQLASTMAHEFNNPLAIIQATYDLHIEPELDDMEPSKQEAMKRIARMVFRMQVLVQRLLTITHLQEKEYINGQHIMDLKASSQAGAKLEPAKKREKAEAV